MLNEVKELMHERLQAIWIFLFALILGFVRILYYEISTKYQIFRSLVLSIWAALVVWLTAYEYQLTFLQIALFSWIAGFLWASFWDFVVKISKEMPEIMKEIILNKIWKWK